MVFDNHIQRHAAYLMFLFFKQSLMVLSLLLLLASESHRPLSLPHTHGVAAISPHPLTPTTSCTNPIPISKRNLNTRPRDSGQETIASRGYNCTYAFFLDRSWCGGMVAYGNNVIDIDSLINQFWLLVTNDNGLSVFSVDIQAIHCETSGPCIQRSGFRQGSEPT